MVLYDELSKMHSTFIPEYALSHAAYAGNIDRYTLSEYI
jgi:hypothetical protein